MRAITAGALLLWCVGCAGPTFVTRPVQDDPNLLVGLVSYKDQGKTALVRHDHPVDWSDADLYAILTGLYVQTGGGLLDSSGPADHLFSSEESALLLPALREAFREARPSDWVGFSLWASSRKTQALEVTSGGMFLQDRRLHIILANHRERVVSEKDGITAIQSNPFHSLRDVKSTLMFHPASYVVDSGTAWMAGGFEYSASELILDYEALLAHARLSTPAGEEGLTASGISSAGSPRESSTNSEVQGLTEEVSKLKEELSRLRRQLAEEAEEPVREKTLEESPSSPSSSPNTSQPAR